MDGLSIYPIQIICIKIHQDFLAVDFLCIFEILYEIKYPMENNFEVNVHHITSKDSDQNLGSFVFPAHKKGKFRTLLKIHLPKSNDLIEWEEIVEVTAILFVISCKNKILIKIGYYLSNQLMYNNKINSNQSFEIDNIFRKILSDKPRITYFPLIKNYNGQ
ncbi:ASF1-like histone chaperone (nucleomorph) [Cryptomonas paramecium]|uniref:ASF1-like histone chaperone n=1 Tax=Cryptomonas paramaecium TaxID=2898 RepID=F2HHW1_9CRYP|nr:ASF1-like histone chaperone [Cryptomonas paramecium]AEA38907.1 ASF1-like histone chaperone [Cryptomonas paramecium]|mmetsp:Transcript_37052/g.98555  ORF Transcript_37052/g.98555 Transcript_37052/m.98555 type:complete len:161 (+) Transcript_37052:10955-11437(+)